MTGLTGKRWYFFIWDEHNEEHLSVHRIVCWEAEEVFFYPYIITPNKKNMDQCDIELMAKQMAVED